MRYFRGRLPVLNLIMPCKVIIPVSYEKEYEKFIFKYVKKIQKQIWELRIRGKIEVRILYTVKNSNVYLLSWFIKKSQKTPISELRKAISRL
jgi:phage-related protein